MTDWNAMSDEAFRRELRAFIEAHYPQSLRYLLRRARYSELKQWWRRLYEHGLIAPNWPREWGGMALEASKMVIYWEEMERYGVARAPDQGITQLGPILMRFGTEEQKRHYLPRALSGEHIWCQGYSEPGAGSDLAALRTAAVLEGEHFVVNGSKIWTTLADEATHIYLLVRTAAGAEPRQGISFLLAELCTPGISIRPIRNLAGHEDFCQVFFDGVRVPRANLVGRLDEGWTVAKALLAFERLAIGSPRRPQYALARLQALARAKGLLRDPGFVDRFIALKLDLEDAAALYACFVERTKRGEALGPEVSALKIWTMETWQRIAALLLETGAEQGVIAGVQHTAGVDTDFLGAFYHALPATIYGGTSEIQRNILARDVLGLPTS